MFLVQQMSFCQDYILYPPPKDTSITTNICLLTPLKTWRFKLVQMVFKFYFEIIFYRKCDFLIFFRAFFVKYFHIFPLKMWLFYVFSCRKCDFMLNSPWKYVILFILVPNLQKIVKCQTKWGFLTYFDIFAWPYFWAFDYPYIFQHFPR